MVSACADTSIGSGMPADTGVSGMPSGSGGIAPGSGCSTIGVSVSSSNASLRSDLSNALQSRSSPCKSVLFASFWLRQCTNFLPRRGRKSSRFRVGCLVTLQRKRVVQRPVMPTLVLRVGLIHEHVSLAEIGENLTAVRNSLFRLRVGRLVVCDRIASSSKRLVMPFLVLRAGFIHEPVALTRTEKLSPLRRTTPPALDRLPRELVVMVSA